MYCLIRVFGSMAVLLHLKSKYCSTSVKCNGLRPFCSIDMVSVVLMTINQAVMFSRCVSEYLRLSFRKLKDICKLRLDSFGNYFFFLRRRRI